METRIQKAETRRLQVPSAKPAASVSFGKREVKEFHRRDPPVAINGSRDTSPRTTFLGMIADGFIASEVTPLGSVKELKALKGMIQTFQSKFLVYAKTFSQVRDLLTNEKKLSTAVCLMLLVTNKDADQLLGRVHEAIDTRIATLERHDAVGNGSGSMHDLSSLLGM